MHLYDAWFAVIAFLWVGYFFLEGFDFGVGVLLTRLGRDEVRRRVLINTIGPVWDGNEVWVIVAGGATFAAFPQWYATLFSGFYLPLLLILVSLILRGVAFEYRGKGDSAWWRRNWDRCITIGSVVPAFGWGVAFANMVRGVDLGLDHDFRGEVVDLLNPYALLGGLVTLSLFTLHGAIYLGLKTTGDVRSAAITAAKRLSAPAFAVTAGFAAWTQVQHGDTTTLLTSAVAAVALLAAVVFIAKSREGWAFAAMAGVIVAVVATLFIDLYPNVMPALDPRYSLSIADAASSPYTLRVMTWVAISGTPLVLLYQGWTYWVFRRRIGIQHIRVDAE
jgi:cytochrome d ubiquinol oxidase subunit II